MEVLATHAHAGMLRCEEVDSDEDEEEFFGFDEESNPSCSQREQPRDEDSEFDESEEDEGIFLPKRRSGKRKRGERSMFGDVDEDEQRGDDQYNELEREKGKTSAMMFRAATQEDRRDKLQGNERSEDENRKRRKEEGGKKEKKNKNNNTKKRGRREGPMAEEDVNALIEMMGLNDDVQLDFDEMFVEMLNKERREINNQGGSGGRPLLGQAGLYTETRPHLVEWLTQLSDPNCFDLCNRTVHLAVSILDCVGSAGLSKESLYLAAVVSLLVAAKHEETEEKVPTLQEMQVATAGRYSDDLIKRMELIVLQRIEWQAMRLTSVLFLQNFARRGACKLFVDEDCFDGKAVRYIQVDELETYMHRYATFFCDACLQDIELSQVEHSVLAAASLACARQALKLSPVWPERLQKITSYDSQALTSHAAKIWNLYNHTIANEREP